MLIVTLLSAVTYGAVTVLLFGDPLQPIALATSWSGRLGIPYWRVVALLCVTTSALIFVLPPRSTIPAVLRPPLFVLLAVLLPTVIVGLYADEIRHRATLALGADEVEERSIFASIREAPADFRFFLHTAALKDCTPFAWSYRTMSFYVLGPSVAGNVLPYSWVERCKLRSSNR